LCHLTSQAISARYIHHRSRRRSHNGAGDEGRRRYLSDQAGARAELIGAVREAITTDALRRARRCEQAAIGARLARLTPRERQVVRLVARGMLNKQIAAELGAAEKTIKTHRSRILDKMGVRTATALVDLLYRARSHANLAPWNEEAGLTDRRGYSAPGH
jgi:DNA-binding NarL/FixJ family response regulator